MACKQNWYTSYPVVLLGLQLTPSTTGFPPFTAVTGSYMMCPHPVITKDTQSHTSQETINTLINEMQKIDFYSNAAGICHSPPQPYFPPGLKNCMKVWLRTDRVRKSLEAPYTGPYNIISRDPKFFILKFPQGNTSVSIDRLKPDYLPTNHDSVPELSSNSSDNITPLPTSSKPPVTSESPDLDEFPEQTSEITLPKITRSGRRVYIN